MFVESYGRVAVAGLLVRARRGPGARRRHPPPGRGGVRGAQRLPHLADVRRDQLAGALHAAVRALGRQPAAVRRPGDQPRGSPSARPSAGPAGARSATCPPTPTTGRRARSTTTTSSTTRATSATAGPRFGYPTMPDQYTLDAFHRLELARQHRRPVMAEIDLISSHAPWSRTPHMIDQAARRRRLGRSTGCRSRLPSETVIWRSPDAGAGGLRAVHRVLPVGAGVVPAALRRRPHRCWCSSATTSRPRSSPARTPTTTCRSPSSPSDPAVLRRIDSLGLAARPAPVARRAGVADGRLPRPVPLRVRAVSRPH